MIEVWANVHRLAGAWAQGTTQNSMGRVALRRPVFGVRDASDLTDPWERRIVELGDGRTVAGIMDVLFCEEVRAGAWMVDIGLWKPLYDRDVVETIYRLAAEGYIRLMPHESSADGKYNLRAGG